MQCDWSQQASLRGALADKGIGARGQVHCHVAFPQGVMGTSQVCHMAGTCLLGSTYSSTSPSPNTWRHSSHSFDSTRQRAARYLNRRSFSRRFSVFSKTMALLYCLLTKYAFEIETQTQAQTTLGVSNNPTEAIARPPELGSLRTAEARRLCEAKSVQAWNPQWRQARAQNALCTKLVPCSM